MNGKGFVSGESVTISLDGKTRATTTAASDGTFRKSLKVSLNTAVGSHTVTASGSQGSSASAQLTVTPGYAASVLAGSPVVYYRLGDTGTTMADSSGNGDDGAYSPSGNVTEGVASALKSDPNKAVTSSGGDPVGVFSSASIVPSGNTPRTIEAWYRSTDTQQHALVSWGTTGQDNAFGMAVNNHQIWIDVYQGTVQFGTTQSIQDGTWHYLVVTWDGSNGVGYLDGQQLSIDSDNVVRPLHTVSPSNLQLGAWVDTVFNERLVGSLDEVAVYPTVLSAADVAAHYHAAGY